MCCYTDTVLQLYMVTWSRVSFTGWSLWFSTEMVYWAQNKIQSSKNMHKWLPIG